MGRSGYSDYDDYDADAQWAMIRHAGARKSALRGRRGQDFLRRLSAALDAMPVKSLIAIPGEEGEYADGEAPPGFNRLGTPDGQVCVLGCLALAEGKKPHEIDATDYGGLGAMFNVAPIVVRDLEWENDEQSFTYGDPGQESMTEGERRWAYLREWVKRNVHTDAPGAKA